MPFSVHHLTISCSGKMGENCFAKVCSTYVKPSLSRSVPTRWWLGGWQSWDTTPWTSQVSLLYRDRDSVIGRPTGTSQAMNMAIYTEWRVPFVHNITTKSNSVFHDMSCGHCLTSSLRSTSDPLTLSSRTIWT